jgi:hypothetical protein
MTHFGRSRPPELAASWLPKRSSHISSQQPKSCSMKKCPLAGVGGPRDHINACGTVTRLLKHLQLPSRAEKASTTTSDAPTFRDIFASLISLPFKFFSSVQPDLCGNCASHGAAGRTRVCPITKAEVAARLWVVYLRPIFLSSPFSPSSFSFLNSSFTAQMPERQS